MRKQTIISFLLALCYGIAFYFLQFILYKLGMVGTKPTGDNIIAWDANWYQDIVNYGSRYWAETNSSAGFFILFPLLWKLLGLNGWTVSFFNLLLFSTGFAIFNSLYKVDLRTKLLWLTIPSFYFAWVPYTESLFILLVVVCFAGIIHKKRYCIWISLFLLALTRPTTLVLVPAFFFMELICNDKKSWQQSAKDFMILYALPLLTGLATFIIYQYYATGVWFAYFKLQSTAWGHEFSIPTLPFSSIFGLQLLWLNAVALFLGFITLAILISSGIKWLCKNDVHQDKIFILSCLYFTGISLVTIFFNPTWGGSTNIFDLHRYAFVSPFFWVLLIRFTIDNQYKIIDYLKILLITNIFWLCLGTYRSIDMLLYFNGSSSAIILYMLLSEKRIKGIAYIVMTLNLVLQVYMFQSFISNVYPG
jgi:hypothetical protein